MADGLERAFAPVGPDCAAEFRSDEPCARADLRAMKIGAAQIRPGEIDAIELGAGEIRAGRLGGV